MIAGLVRGWRRLTGTRSSGSAWQVDPVSASSTPPHRFPLEDWLTPLTAYVINQIYHGRWMTYEIAWSLLVRDSLWPHFGYRHFTKPKADGSPRQLAEPDPRLKAVQQSILTRCLTPQSPHPAALGFRRGKSTADHAWAHAGAAVIISADVADFFASTQADRVEQWWRDYFPTQYAYSPHADPDPPARLFRLLTTHRGGLPQGAPTSPALSNLVNLTLDARLERRAAQSGGRYTRYGDDLAFSWRGQNRPPADFERGVRAALAAFGYVLNSRKGWQVYSANDEPTITGVILTRDGRVVLPPQMRATMRRLAKSADLYDHSRLEGYRAYEHMITRGTLPRMRSQR